MLVIKVLCEVDLGLWLVYGDALSGRYGHNIHIFLLHFLLTHGPLPDANCDLVVAYGVSILKWVKF